MKEITFIVQEADEGGYYAESVGIGIFAEGDCYYLYAVKQ